MIEGIYQMYKEQRRLLDNPEWATEEVEKIYLAEIKVGVVILEESHPEYKNRLEREKKIQASFTRDQIDFICWQIGEWYFHMKTLLEGQHNLGHKKELLKQMICGDEA